MSPDRGVASAHDLRKAHRALAITCHACADDDDRALGRRLGQHAGVDVRSNAKVDVPVVVQKAPCGRHVRAVLVPDGGGGECLRQPPGHCASEIGRAVSCDGVTSVCLFAWAVDLLCMMFSTAVHAPGHVQSPCGQHMVAHLHTASPQHVTGGWSDFIVSTDGNIMDPPQPCAATALHAAAAHPAVHALVAVGGQQVLLLCRQRAGREAKRPGGLGVQRGITGLRAEDIGLKMSSC